MRRSSAVMRIFQIYITGIRISTYRLTLRLVLLETHAPRSRYCPLSRHADRAALAYVHARRRFLFTGGTQRLDGAG